MLTSIKWVIYFCTQCKDREMDTPGRLRKNLPVAGLLSWPVTLSVKECLLSQYICKNKCHNPIFGKPSITNIILCISKTSQSRGMKLFSLLEVCFGNTSLTTVTLKGIECGGLIPQGNLRNGIMDCALSSYALRAC